MTDYLQFYIDGAWVDPATSKTLDVINPATEEPVGKIAMGSAAVDDVIGPEGLPQDAQIVLNNTGKHFRGASNAHIEKYGQAPTVLESDTN